MKVANTSGSERVLSHRGQDYHLLPGQSAEVAMTADEAEALSSIFEITGRPEAAGKPRQARWLIAGEGYSPGWR